MDTHISPPSAPIDCDFMYSGLSSTVYLLWSPPVYDGGAPISQYLLSLTPTNEPTTEYIIQAPITYYNLDTLVHGITVQATVKASNNDGITYGSEGIFPPIVPLLPPMPPSTAEATAIGPGVANISWTPPETPIEGKAYYFIQSQSSNPSSPNYGFGTRDTTDLSYVMNGLDPTSEYSFTVQVVGQIARSDVTTTNTIVFPSELSLSNNITAESIDTSAFEAAPMAPPITTEEPLPDGYTDAPETV